MKESRISNGIWMKDQNLKEIPKEKLNFLQLLFVESQKIKNEEMLPFFLSVMKLSKEKNISFSSKEMELILSVLKSYATPEELTKLEELRHLTTMFTNRPGT